MPIDYAGEIEGQTITDIEKQPFTDQASLPAGATATADKLVIVLGNGRTLEVVGVKLSGGAPRLHARLLKNQPVTDSDSIA